MPQAKKAAPVPTYWIVVAEPIRAHDDGPYQHAKEGYLAGAGTIFGGWRWTSNAQRAMRFRSPTQARKARSHLLVYLSTLKQKKDTEIRIRKVVR